MLPLWKDGWVYPDGRYVERKPRKSSLSDLKQHSCSGCRAVNSEIEKRWFVHELHIYSKMQQRDGNSINICGARRSSLRWAAICRLISGRYIIEISLLLFFPSPISISWRKCKPRASNWDDFMYIYQHYSVRELWKLPLDIFYCYYFCSFASCGPQKDHCGHRWCFTAALFIYLFIISISLSFSFSTANRRTHTLTQLSEAVRWKTIR